MRKERPPEKDVGFKTEKALIVFLFFCSFALFQGCAGLWDASVKTLDATIAVADCADGDEYTADESNE